MDVLTSYEFIISASVIVILSYLFNLVGKKTSVPSVLMLIVLGMLIKQGMLFFGVPIKSFMPQLEILGVIGLIMIVLEAALDLELKREKWPIIWRSFMVSLLGLVGCAFALAFVISFFFEVGQLTSLLYAVPLSILSSAIIIPSVANLQEDKKEFMIYESTFSDILGIMMFYLLLGIAEPSGHGNPVINFFGSFLLTVILSVALSIVLVLLFQKISTHVKMFLLIAILLLLYSIGKLLHLSSLIMILIFGLVLKNYKAFFVGFLKKWVNDEKVRSIGKDFYTVTIESAFVVRTFFFVLFGLSIALVSLKNLQVVLVSVIFLVFMYVVRFGVLKLFVKGRILPQLYIAPRGLITILLFFALQSELSASNQINDFDSGILLFVILVSSIIMMVAMIRERKTDVFDKLFTVGKGGEQMGDEPSTKPLGEPPSDTHDPPADEGHSESQELPD